MVDFPRPKRGRTNIGGRTFVWGDRTFIMGVINVTPDSFSGDGLGTDVDAVVRTAELFREWGADVLDVGGESTRPASIYAGAGPVGVDEELARVVPAIEAVAREVDIPVSVDTTKAAVAEEAIAAGAAMVNDQWALGADEGMLEVVSRAAVPVVLMHNRPDTHYADLVPDVVEELRLALRRAVQGGVDAGKIILDPGIGFGKTAEQNLEVLRRLDELGELGCPLLVGTSRKSTIGRVLGLPVDERIEGTAATVALSVAAGADMVRVHDVREMARVARMSDAIVRGWRES